MIPKITENFFYSYLHLYRNQHSYLHQYLVTLGNERMKERSFKPQNNFDRPDNTICQTGEGLAVMAGLSSALNKGEV